MSTSRLIRSLVVAAGICVLVGAGPGGLVRGQQPEPHPRRRSATDASFVLTDVFVTADGKPVTDLTQADFEVREDGVVQTIRSFEAVRHDGAVRPAAAPQSVVGRREQRDGRAIRAAACSSCSSTPTTSIGPARWSSARRCRPSSRRRSARTISSPT